MFSEKKRLSPAAGNTGETPSVTTRLPRIPAPKPVAKIPFRVSVRDTR